MQALILSAGKGIRLGKFVDGKPKSLLELNKRTIIDRHIELLRKHGVGKIFIVVGHNFRAVKEALKNISDVSFIYNPFYEQTNVLASVWCAKNFLTEDYIYLHGDTVFEEKILEKVIAKKGDIILPIEFKKCQVEDMKVILHNKRIIKIDKELSLDEAVGEFIGLAKITRPVFEVLNGAIDELMMEKQFNCFFEKALQRLIDKYGIKYSILPINISGLFWEEIDFREDFLRANNYYKKHDQTV